MATNPSDPVARIYAVALYETARDKGIVGDVQKGLEVLLEAWQDRAFRNFFTSPRVPRAVKIRAMDEALGAGAPLELLNFIKVLIAKGREPQFDNIVNAFGAYRDSAENRVHAWVESGSDFDQAALERVKLQLSAAAGGREVVLHYSHEPALIGGARIRLGDRLIDNTVRSRLAKLANALREGVAT
jgi:F-type H+-transporting ATPase subunit delta